jgi:hypothetical protein
MATELRYIILSNAEFTSSLQSFRRTHEDFLPNGEIVSWTAGENETIDITISIKGGSTVNQMIFTIEAQHVIDILVRFCMENNVPVPRAGVKSWSIKKEGITLAIALEGRELERANTEMEALA